MAGRVGTADRVRLTQQVVGEADVAVGILAADLGQRGADPSAHLLDAEAHQRGDVLVALLALRSSRSIALWSSLSATGGSLRVREPADAGSRLAMVGAWQRCSSGSPGAGLTRCWR